MVITPSRNIIMLYTRIKWHEHIRMIWKNVNGAACTFKQNKLFSCQSV